MAKTFKKTQFGTVEVFEDGKRVSTVSLEHAKQLGFKETSVLEKTLTPIGTDRTLTPEQPKTLQQGTNPLIDFSEMLSKVTDLARKKRNRMTLELLGKRFDPSAEPASGFFGILADVNRAGREFAEEKIGEFEDRGELVSEIVGGFEILRNKRTGEIVSTRGVKKDVDVISISSPNQTKLLGAGFTSDDIKNIENDVNQHGLDKVLEGIENETQKKALREVYGVTEKITREQIEQQVDFSMKSGELNVSDILRNNFTKDELDDLASEAGFAGWFGLSKGELENYLESEKGREEAKKVYADLLFEQYRTAGMTAE